MTTMTEEAKNVIGLGDPEGSLGFPRSGLHFCMRLGETLATLAGSQRPVPDVHFLKPAGLPFFEVRSLQERVGFLFVPRSVKRANGFKAVAGFAQGIPQLRQTGLSIWSCWPTVRSRWPQAWHRWSEIMDAP